MSFDFEIKADPAPALAAEEKVVQGLEELDKVAQQVSQSVSSSWQRQARAADGRFQTTNEGVKAVGKSIADLPIGASTEQLAEWEKMLEQGAAKLKLQEELLDQIKTPLANYEASLEAVNVLLDKGKISTSEYADAVTRLNGALQRARPSDTMGTSAPGPGTMYGPTYDPTKAGAGGGLFGGGGAGGGISTLLSSQLGTAGTMMNSLAGGITLVNAAAIAGAVALAKLGDAYLELTNAVQRFATAGRSANDIVDDQLRLAGQLHASISDTSALYLRVREGADGLNLSYQQTMTLTQALGQSMQLSGHSMGQAASVMERLAYAMDSGQLSARELRSVMRADPVLAQSWAEFFHTTESGLLQMATHGQLTARDLVAATEAAAPTIAKEWDSQAQTAGAAWQHFKDTAVVAFGELGASSSSTIANLLNGLSEVVSLLGTVLGKVNEVATSISGLKLPDSFGGKSLGDFGIGNMDSSWMTNLPVEALKDAKKLAEDLGASLGPDKEAIAAAAEQTKQWLTFVQELGVEWNNLSEKVNGDGWKNVGVDVDAAREKLVGFLKASGQTALATQIEVGQHMEQAFDLAAFAAEKFFEKMADGADASRANIAHMDEGLLLLAGTMAGGLGRAGLEALVGLGDAAEVAYKTADAAHMKLINALTDEEKLLREITSSRRDYDAELENLIDLYNKGSISAKQYAEWQEKILTESLKASGWQAQYDAMKKLLDSLDAVERKESSAASAHEQLAKAQEVLNQAVARNVRTQDEADADMAALTSRLHAQLDPYDALVTKIKEQTAAYESSAEAQKVSQEVERDLMELKKQGANVDDTQAASLRRLVQAQQDRARLMSVEQGIYQQIVDPAQKYELTMQALADLQSRSTVTTEQYNRIVDQTRLAYLNASGEARTMAGGTEAAWLKMKDDATNVGQQIGKVFTDAFGSINEALVQLVTNGTVNWKSMIDSILADLTRLLANQAFAYLLSLGGAAAAGAAGGGLGGAITPEAAPSGGSPLGLVGSSSQLVFGGAFATGGSFGVGGTGGTDSQLVAFRATPGEEVSVSNPNRRGDRGQSSGRPQIHNHFHYGDKDLLRGVQSPSGNEVVSDIASRSVGTQVAVRDRLRRR